MPPDLHRLLAELESHQLHVILVPLDPRKRGYNEGGCRRVCADRNPRWYSRLCADHPSSRVRNHRKPDTRVRRQNILRVLRRLCAGLSSRSQYAPRLLKIAARAA